MTLFHKLVVLIIVLVLVGMGAMFTITAWSADEWRATVLLIERSRLVAACAGIGFLCLAALFVLSGIPRKKRTHFLSFDSKGGTTSISTDAIADYLMKLADEFPSIDRMKPRVVPAKNTIDIVVNVRIKAGPQIHEICELLRQRVRESMTEGLGISEIRRVEVSVKDIISEHKPS